MKMNGGSKTNLKKLNGTCIIMTEIRNGELKMKSKNTKPPFHEGKRDALDNNAGYDLLENVTSMSQK